MNMNFRATVGALALILGLAGCSGHKNTRQQYADRVKEINEKFDEELVKPDAKLSGGGNKSCADFIDKLRSTYKYWKPGEAGEKFCARRPGSRERRDFELHVRALHNKGVTVARNKRLSNLKASYEETLKNEDDKSSDAADVAEGKGDAGFEPGEIPDAATAAPRAVPRASARTARQAPPEAEMAPMSELPTPRRPRAPVRTARKEPAAFGPAGEQLPHAEEEEEAAVAPTPIKITRTAREAPTEVRTDEARSNDDELDSGTPTAAPAPRVSAPLRRRSGTSAAPARLHADEPPPPLPGDKLEPVNPPEDGKPALDDVPVQEYE